MDLKQGKYPCYKVKDNTVTVIDDYIIMVEAIGEQTKEIAETHLEYHCELAKIIKGKINYVIDLNKCGKNHSDARKIWKILSEKPETDKVALIGMHPVAKVIASFFLGLTNNKNTGFFNSKEEAFQWIKQENKDKT